MDERKIVEMLMSKDEKGMEEFLLEYSPLMRYIIAPILPTEQDKEDCLYEAAMQVWQKIESYDPSLGSFNSWLTAVTRNYALNFRRNILNHINTNSVPSDTPSPDLNPEEMLIITEQNKALKQALKCLSEKERILLYRKYYYRQTTAQIASEMCMTVRAVEGKLYRIKKRLRKELGGEIRE